MFDFICMWSNKFDKSIQLLVPAIYFQIVIMAPTVKGKLYIIFEKHKLKYVSENQM